MVRVLRRKNVRDVYECPVCYLPFTRRGHVKEHGMMIHELSEEEAEKLRLAAKRGYETTASVVRWEE